MTSINTFVKGTIQNEVNKRFIITSRTAPFISGIIYISKR